MMKSKQKNWLDVIFIGIVILFVTSFGILGAGDEKDKKEQHIKRQFERMNHRLDMLEKVIDDVLWYQRVGDIAFIDKVRLTGPPLWMEKNPTGQGAGNPVKFYAYVFVPKNIDLILNKD